MYLSILFQQLVNVLPYLNATPSDRVISAGDALTLDFGCLYDHYVSDMTRTIYAGHVSDKEREIYETVLKANQALIDAAKDGLGFRDFDKIPRDVIERSRLWSILYSWNRSWDWAEISTKNHTSMANV